MLKVQDDLATGTVGKGGCLSPVTQASRRPIHLHTSGQAARQMSLWQRIPFFFPGLSVPALSCLCSPSAPVWPDSHAEWRACLSGPWTQGWHPYPALTLKAHKTPSLVWPAPALAWPTSWAASAISLQEEGRVRKKVGVKEVTDRKRTKGISSHTRLYLFENDFRLAERMKKQSICFLAQQIVILYTWITESG